MEGGVYLWVWAHLVVGYFCGGLSACGILASGSNKNFSFRGLFFLLVWMQLAVWGNWGSEFLFKFAE